MELATKNDKGVKYITLTVDALLQRACFMQILRITLKVMTKSWGGTNTLLVPPPSQKVEGDLSPPVPMVVAPMIHGMLADL